MNGYAGKILRVNLTTRSVTIIPTSDYERWVGGHGMGSAIFFDLVKDKTIDGFDPANVVTMMTSPLAGTLVPAGTGRTEVQGIGVQSYPVGWFTRSNFGGRFSTMLKCAGWDGIVLEGRADEPVWLDVRDDDLKEGVHVRDCAPLSLWETDTWECQKRIWHFVAEGKPYGDWIDPGGREWGETTQRPAVVAIGPAGENRSRMACLIHDAANGSGQGGFGAVWGSKNLKAVSVIGTGSIHVHDPQALMKARLMHKNLYGFDLDDVRTKEWTSGMQAPPVPGVLWGPAVTDQTPGAELWQRPVEGHRPQACTGCHSGCRARYESGLGNEASCVDTLFYSDADSLEVQRKASDLLNRYGLNAYEMLGLVPYLRALHEMDVLGPGKKIDCPLDFNKPAYGSFEFVEALVKMVSCRNDGHEPQFVHDLREGAVRAAEKWGRLDEDLTTGLLPYPHWGLPVHYDPRAELEWGYGTILGDRDINEHDFNGLFWDPTLADWYGREPMAAAEEAVRIYTDKMVPYQGDLLMLDYSDENMYSEHMAKLVAWHRHYTRFWKQSCLFCDWRWPDFINLYAPEKRGCTGTLEPLFLKAVTGKDLSFAQGIELGRAIWNLDHAIWTLQGRHRDDVHFAEYVYSVPLADEWGPKYLLPGRENGQWDYFDYAGRHLDKKGFEEFKTRFYELEGWDPRTGYPTRRTLEQLCLDLDDVIVELKKHGKLGEDNDDRVI